MQIGRRGPCTSLYTIKPFVCFFSIDGYKSGTLKLKNGQAYTIYSLSKGLTKGLIL